MKQLILITVICAFALTEASAQSFETGTATNPHWYFIQVKGSGDNAGKVVTEIDGRAYGRPKETGFAAKAKQLWRIEIVPNTSPVRYEVINKHSGNKLDVVYDSDLNERMAVVSETPSTIWTIQLQAGNYYTLRIVTQPQGGLTGAGYLTQGGESLNQALYFTKSAGNADAQFQFISIDAPVVSEGSETIWFSIHNAQNAFSNQCLTEVETATNTQLSLLDFTANNHRQLWKIVNNPASAGTVNFVNRQTGHLISAEPLYDIYNYARFTDNETSGWTIDDLGSNQYEVRTGVPEERKYWYAATAGVASAGYRQGASSNTGFAWQFRLRDDGTTQAFHTPESNLTRVWVENKRIFVEGNEHYRVYTLYGTRVNENSELPAGIYLVSVKNKTTKVLVK
jgi:hypothetical protein